MTAVLPPDLSITFIAAILVPILLGFLVGIVLKEALKIGLAIAAIVLVLIFLGFVQPAQLVEPIVSAFRSGPALVSKVDQIAGYLPYSSITFIIGLIIGFFKG